MAEHKKAETGTYLFGFVSLALIVTGIAGLFHAFIFRDGAGIVGAARAFGIVY